MAGASKKTEGTLASTVAAFENELAKYEEAVNDVAKVQINSDKSLQRGRRALEELAALEQGLAQHLHAFVNAMQGAQERQQKCMEATVRVAEKIKSRFDDRNNLLSRVAQLGQLARDINEPVSAVMTQREGGVPEAELLASLQEVTTRTEAVIAEADAVQRAAKESDWLDIERDTDTLKQQLQAARNKVLVAHRSIASRAPS